MNSEAGFRRGYSQGVADALKAVNDSLSEECFTARVEWTRSGDLILTLTCATLATRCQDNEIG